MNIQNSPEIRIKGLSPLIFRNWLAVLILHAVRIYFTPVKNLFLRRVKLDPLMARKTTESEPHLTSHVCLHKLYYSKIIHIGNWYK